MPSTGDALERTYAVAEVAVVVRAPREVVAILDRTLSRLTASAAEPELQVTVERDDAWRIRRSHSPTIVVLDRRQALAEVAGATVSAIVGTACLRSRKLLLKAVVVERDTRALALVGDDWEAAVMIAAHLNVRGWRFVSAHHNFVDESLAIAPVQKLLVVTSALLPQLPLEYRSLAERSQWCSNRDGLLFYTVDPHESLGESAWSTSAVLQAVLLVSGTIGHFASVDDVARDDLDPYLPQALRADPRLAFGSVVLSSGVGSADVVERWSRLCFPRSAA
ncbi:MAG: hypothetical protein ACREM2_05070 [Vulcanimicrobiaceae bacterium]